MMISQKGNVNQIYFIIRLSLSLTIVAFLNTNKLKIISYHKNNLSLALVIEPERLVHRHFYCTKVETCAKRRLSLCEGGLTFLAATDNGN